MEIPPVKDELIRTCLSLAPGLTQLPAHHIWVDYDQDVNVLYLSFRKPQKATKTVEMDDGDVLVRTDDDEIVGITIINASTQ